MPDTRNRFEKLMDSDRRADEREAGLSWRERRDQTAFENSQQKHVYTLYDQYAAGK
jgi:hypothetical protein